jgi:flagellar basal-body rod protein FlgB
MFGYVDVLKTAADASWAREEVLTNNIANVDTPNYKRQDVEFTTYLKSALSRSGGDSTSLTNRVNNINYNDVTMRTYTDNSTLSYRLDGNNVDLSTENVELASEQLNYNGLIDSMNNEFTNNSSFDELIDNVFLAKISESEDLSTITDQEIIDRQETLINKIRGKKSVISVMKIIEQITEIYDDAQVISIGEPEVLVEYDDNSKNKILEALKVAAVCILIFFGSAFTIMAFNNDISISGVFEHFYKQIMGVDKPQVSVLEVFYCIGRRIVFRSTG